MDTIVSHYENPFVEQRDFFNMPVAIHLSHKRVIRVTGTDRDSWLHLLTTQFHDVQRMQDQQYPFSSLSLILDQHGHLLHILHVIQEAKQAWIIADEQYRYAMHPSSLVTQTHSHALHSNSIQSLLDYLSSMKFRADVTVCDVSDTHTVIFENIARQDNELPSWLVPEEYNSAIVADTIENRFLASRPNSFFGREVIVSVDNVEERLLRSRQIGMWAYEALRIASGYPSINDYDNKTFPQELGFIGVGVHLDKGCYCGQEVVAKIQNVGSPPRGLTLLYFDGDAVNIAPGSNIVHDTNTCGMMTSFAQHYELGPIGLGLIKFQFLGKKGCKPEMIFNVNEHRAVGEQIVSGPKDTEYLADINRIKQRKEL